MENPASRPPIAQFIDTVIKEYDRKIVFENYVGWSLAMTIYDALKQRGYLKEE